jgi:hypothetical protein
MKNVRVALLLHPNLKAARAKVMSPSNMVCRPGEGHVKIRNHKLDYSKGPQ